MKLIAILFSVVCMGQNYNLDTSLTDYGTPPNLNKPNYLQTVTDPLFGTKITRITGDVGTSIPNASGETWRNVARHGYSTRQPWNADESIIYLNINKTLNGSWGSSLFLNGETYEVIKKSNIPSANEQRWHPTDPDIILLLRDSGIYAWSYLNNTTTELYSLSGYSNTSLGYTGNWNDEGNMLAMSAIRNSDGKQVVFAVNTDTQVKSGDIDMNGFNIDYVTISPSGEFIIVNGNGDTTKVFDWSRRQVGPYWSNYGEPSHYDVTTYDGWDYAVGVSKSNPHDGRIISRNVFTGDIKELTQGGYGSHSSARQISRQGWVFSYNSSWAPYNDEIIASRLDGNRVERIVSVRGSYDIYENQAQPVVSPSGTRVIYASDWNNGSVPIQGYVVDFRDKAFPLDIKYPTIEGLVIYPIPSKDMLYVNGDYDVTLYDLSGKVVGNSLDISKLSNGVYIIELVDGDKRHVQKIVKW